MPTEFTSIYRKFLSKIAHYEYLSIEQEDAERLFHSFLETAISKFQYACRKDLTALSATSFLEELSTEEQDILATFMVVAHVERAALTEDNLRNSINSSDYRQYSSANLLKILMQLRDTIEHDALTRMRNYDNHSFLKEWEEENE